MFTNDTPVNFTESVIADSPYKLANAGFDYAIVQVQDPLGLYVDKNEALCYNRQGIIPLQIGALGGPTGFVAGVNDTIVFTNAELRQTVYLINAIVGSSVKITIQYYKDL